MSELFDKGGKVGEVGGPLFGEDEGITVETHVPMAIASDINTQIVTARQFPRQVTTVLNEAATLALRDEATAESCFYALPRGGKTIMGPSVRLAEILAITWTNLRCSARIVEIGDEFVVAEGMAWDLQTNTATSKQVQRRITYKDGGRFNEDMIAVTANAAMSIAYREAIFKIVPRTYVNRIYLACQSAAVGKAETIVQKRETVLATIRKMGVKDETILNSLGCAGKEEIGLNEIAILIGLSSAIKEGDTSVDEAFPVKNKKPDADVPKDNAGKVKESLRKGKAKEEAPDADAEASAQAEASKKDAEFYEKPPK